MEKTITLMPGYRTAEYRLALLPHHDLRKRIMHVREGYAEKYGLATWPKAAFLTLARFQLYKMNEERLINRLNSITMASRPFKLDIRDFGSWPDHSIFLNIANPGPLKELSASVQEIRSMVKAGEVKPHFLKEFNFLVAGKLKPWQYEQGWKEYSQKHFSASFIAAEMVLLRQEPSGLKFQVCGHFEFRDLPVGVTQGELF